MREKWRDQPPEGADRYPWKKNIVTTTLDRGETDTE